MKKNRPYCNHSLKDGFFCSKLLTAGAKAGIAAAAGCLVLFATVSCSPKKTEFTSVRESSAETEASGQTQPQTELEGYLAAAKQGDAEAMCKLGKCYEYGWGVEKS